MQRGFYKGTLEFDDVENEISKALRSNLEEVKKSHPSTSLHDKGKVRVAEVAIVQVATSLFADKEIIIHMFCTHCGM